ncbi:hypothetical protein [Glutamicibacter sp. TV12E]|uniref:hypothetical protein n=1 Tax=Glutamicibacter sp. TV12E TaxID=3446362 RepID=UPI004034F4FC
MAKKNVDLYIDPKALNTFLNGTTVQQASMRKAQMGLATAKATAPRKTSRFAAGFQVQPATVQGGRRNENRAGAVIVNKVEYSAFVHRRQQENFFKLLRKRMDGQI